MYKHWACALRLRKQWHESEAEVSIIETSGVAWSDDGEGVGSMDVVIHCVISGCRAGGVGGEPRQDHGVVLLCVRAKAV